MNSSFAHEGESSDIIAEPIETAESADPAAEYLIGITKPEETEDCCAVLLRGGKSRRMGRDKALLYWKESTFLETIAAQLEFLDEKYLSVAGLGIDSDAESLSAEETGDRKANDSDQNLLPDDWVRLPDLIPDCGPLGGIYTALVSCRAQWALVASCDIPAVERRLFTMLLENRTEEADIIYPLTPDGRMHMTCALYRKTIAPVILAQIEKGDNRLRILSDLCRSKEILIDQPDYLCMLSNINTGAELDTIRKSRN